MSSKRWRCSFSRASRCNAAASPASRFGTSIVNAGGVRYRPLTRAAAGICDDRAPAIIGTRQSLVTGHRSLPSDEPVERFLELPAADQLHRYIMAEIILDR